MKKFYLIAVMVLCSLAGNAQLSLNLSTYNGTKLDRYDGKECNVTVNRYVFHGWNTISLPFNVTESELNDIYGSDCKLEKLVGAESNGNHVTVYFQDCKAGGIEANVPYLLYYTGENGNKKIAKSAMITAGVSELSVMAKGNGDMVTMGGAQSHFSGLGCYGILVKDNADANFTTVDESTSGFYATRCFLKLSSGNSATISAIHLAAGSLASIQDVATSKEKVDVYTLSGVKVASGISAKQVNKLQPGVYVVNGQKIAVK